MVMIYQTMMGEVMPANMIPLDNQDAGDKRISICSDDIGALTQIYDENVNIAIWRRHLPADVVNDVTSILQTTSHLNTSTFVDANSITNDVTEALQVTNTSKALIDNISELIDVFCVLFEQPQVGLRLRLLDTPMCPRFHVDRVACRLVTAFSGSGSQWLEHNGVNRSKLGRGSNGLDDSVSGLFKPSAQIHTLGIGDVALFKGETWYNNKNAGLVHRSPPFIEGEKRLLMTIDLLS